MDSPERATYIHAYTMYIHDISLVYIYGRYKCISSVYKGIYNEYVVNIHGISIVYYTYILHQVAGFEKEGRVPFHRLHQQSHPSRLDKS